MASSFISASPGRKLLISHPPATSPTINSTDAALMKNWLIRERYKLQFRWEMFNAFNHPSFGIPNTDPTSSSFGQITSIGPIPARVMQGALKLTF